MQNFLTKSAPGLLAISAAAVVGYVLLMPPAATAGRPAAVETASHISDCPVCRLPLYGRTATPSKLGYDFRGGSENALAPRQDTIRK